ncbi:MAG: hypothetical protein WDW38_008223 [Sanguina aurantia]
MSSKPALPFVAVQYYCAGYSTYPTDGNDSKGSSGAGLMPYCEGLETVSHDTTRPMCETRCWVPEQHASPAPAHTQRMHPGLPSTIIMPRCAQIAVLEDTSDETVEARGTAPAPQGSNEAPSSESPVDQSLQAKFIAKFAENLGKVSSGLSGGSSSSNNSSPGSGGAGGSSSSSSTEGSALLPSEFLNKFLATAQSNAQRISSASSGMANAVYCVTLKPLHPDPSDPSPRVCVCVSSRCVIEDADRRSGPVGTPDPAVGRTQDPRGLTMQMGPARLLDPPLASRQYVEPCLAVLLRHDCNRPTTTGKA